MLRKTSILYLTSDKGNTMDLNHCMEKHAEWKTRFRKAIAGKETMDVDTISKDNCCDLGKWLHGEAKTQFFKLQGYSACVIKHAEFHTEAGKVAKAINTKNYIAAEAMLNAGTTYMNASSAVGIAIMRLKKEAGI